MASKTEIANIAVACHAGDWIDDIDATPGAMADAIRTMWNATADEALSQHLWKFGKGTWKDQPALPAADNPDPDLANAYRVPPDCLRVFELRPQVEFDEWEGPLITTAAGPTVTMIGVKKDVDIGRWAAMFNVYFGKLLAFNICTPIAASEAIRKRCREEADAALIKAISNNGKVGKLRVVMPDRFLAARMGRG